MSIISISISNFYVYSILLLGPRKWHKGMKREAADILGLPENFSEAPAARSFVWLMKAIHSKMSEVEWLQIDWLKSCPSLATSVPSSLLQPEAVKISSRISIHKDANSSDASELLQCIVWTDPDRGLRNF